MAPPRALPLLAAIAAAACLLTPRAAWAQPLAPDADEAALDKPSFLGSSAGALPSVEATLTFDGFSQQPVPWARGSDPAFGFLRTRGTQLIAGEGIAATPVYFIGALRAEHEAALHRIRTVAASLEAQHCSWVQKLN
jgi:hypothetical protein